MIEENFIGKILSSEFQTTTSEESTNKKNGNKNKKSYPTCLS